MRWAITPRGVGVSVGFRAINSQADVLPGEFFFEGNPTGKVLADDGASLRDVTTAETLQRAKAAKLEELRQARNVAIAEGVEFQGNRYWSDRDSIADVRGAIVGFDMLDALPAPDRATLPVPSAVRWKTKNGHVSLNRRELILLCAAMSIHQQAQFAIEEQLIAQTEAARTEAEVNAVSWPNG